jgi:hypothetical protein
MFTNVSEYFLHIQESCYYEILLTWRRGQRKHLNLPLSSVRPKVVGHIAGFFTVTAVRTAKWTFLLNKINYDSVGANIDRTKYNQWAFFHTSFTRLPLPHHTLFRINLIIFICPLDPTSGHLLASFPYTFCCTSPPLSSCPVSVGGNL